MGCDGENDGVLADLGCEDDPEVCYYGDKRDWIAGHLSELLFDSKAVVEAATSSAPWIELPGIYFLIFGGRVVYVGQASHIGMRLEAHFKEGRPIGAMAFIVGVPRWILDEVEHAYIGAWSPPWNVEKMRRGALDYLVDFKAAAGALDKSMVSPEYPAKAPHVFFKAWQLHVMGYVQAHPELFPRRCAPLN